MYEGSVLSWMWIDGGMDADVPSPSLSHHHSFFLLSLINQCYIYSTFILDRIYRESDYLQQIFRLLRTLEKEKENYQPPPSSPMALSPGVVAAAAAAAGEEEGGIKKEGQQASPAAAAGGGEKKTKTWRERREEVWMFLKELVGLSKSTQPSNQAAFFK